MEIIWSQKVTTEDVPERIGEKTFVGNIVRRKANWISHILRRNSIHDSIEGQKGVERRRTTILDDLRNRRRY
jgi:hypothetical protein